MSSAQGADGEGLLELEEEASVAAALSLAESAGRRGASFDRAPVDSVVVLDDAASFAVVEERGEGTGERRNRESSWGRNVGWRREMDEDSSAVAGAFDADGDEVTVVSGHETDPAAAVVRGGGGGGCVDGVDVGSAVCVA